MNPEFDSDWPDIVYTREEIIAETQRRTRESHLQRSCEYLLAENDFLRKENRELCREFHARQRQAVIALILLDVILIIMAYLAVLKLSS